MELEAFPSNVSAGTTDTQDMEFVGSNYDAYRPQQENSYFKEDGFCPVDDNLSLGNLDSGTTIDSGGGSMKNVHEQMKGQPYDRQQAQNGHHYQSNIKIIEPQHDQAKVRGKRRKNKHLEPADQGMKEEESRTGSYNHSPAQPRAPISEMADSGG